MPTLGTPITADLMKPGSCWKLLGGQNGYARPTDDGLATQAAAGRHFKIAAPVHPEHHGRVQAVLLEDGYPCWLSMDELVGQAVACEPWQPSLLSSSDITSRLGAVLEWLNAAAAVENTYLWGGTIGPDLDCSGLVQTAFASTGIWLPRDAYQQERFCQPLAVQPDDVHNLQAGDLIFFGTPERCTHVGIHLESGRYMHSSGTEHGRNGIGIDGLNPEDLHPVACHYRAELRGAGRVMRCHDGSTLP
jgi:cell wall-associated NlpC family hydrolase